MRTDLTISWPIVVFDADYFPYVLTHPLPGGLALEPELVQEVVAAFDAVGRSVTITLNRDWTAVEFTLRSSDPDVGTFDDAAKEALKRHHDELPLVLAEDLKGMGGGVPGSVVAMSREKERPAG